MTDLWRPPCPCGADCLRAHATQVSPLTAAGRALAAAGVLLTALLRPRAASWVARALLRVMGVRWSMVGAPVRPGALLTGNHVSWLDIVVMMAAAPSSLTPATGRAGVPARSVPSALTSAIGRAGFPARLVPSALASAIGRAGFPARSVPSAFTPATGGGFPTGSGGVPTRSRTGGVGAGPRLRMVAKTEVGGWPVIGGLARAAGTIFVDRSRPRMLPQTVAQVAEALRSGDAVQVFPEGTTTCGAHPARWRPAFLQAALDAGAPVQRFTLLFSTQRAAFVADESLLTSLWRVLRLRGLSVTVLVDEAQPVGATNRRELAARLSPKRLEKRVHDGRRT